MNVLRLPQTTEYRIDHNPPSQRVPKTCAAIFAFSGGKYFCQSAIVKRHHSVRNPQNPALCIAYCSNRTCPPISKEEPRYRHIAAGVKSSKSVGIRTSRGHESTKVASTA